MWDFIMKGEPSAFRLIHCKCGYSLMQEVSYFYLNPEIIAKDGFKNLQEAVIDKWENALASNCECGQKPLESLKLNAHIFIDGDVRSLDGKETPQMCNALELPNYITLYGLKFRLTGVVIYDESLSHYTALCTTKYKNWEIYDDLNSKVTAVNKKHIQPGGIIYIQIQG
ncbi:uncharacterized protein LOC127286795 [Leptopilina boulardi]|uniref:uncharacterized protein LOC127286795 n=1 Tax=Leptopilina boulardi TaxID=63433 RepID=UPI0021F502F7|nr:uncharacterized protein LOC127286795 [Leptopilina boulardi]